MIVEVTESISQMCPGRKEEQDGRSELVRSELLCCVGVEKVQERNWLPKHMFCGRWWETDTVRKFGNRYSSKIP